MQYRFELIKIIRSLSYIVVKTKLTDLYTFYVFCFFYKTHRSCLGPGMLRTSVTLSITGLILVEIRYF